MSAPATPAERTRARSHLADLIERHGSYLAVARACRVPLWRVHAIAMGDLSRRTVDALERAHAAIRRCAGCGDVLHARWTDASCAACQAAAVEEADEGANDGSFAEWMNRRAS